MDCIVKHKFTHRSLCMAIVELEKLESQKSLERLGRQHENRLPVKMQREIVALVGEKPIVNVELDEEDFPCLLDTGAQVSMMSKRLLAERFPEKRIYSLQEFVGHKDFNISAANNTNLPIEGVVLLDFGVDDEVLFQVPFLICRDDLTHTIIGYNTIKHLVKNYPHKQIAAVVKKMLPNLSEGDAESFVNIIEESSNQSDVLGDVKTCETVRIPGNCMVKVKGRTRVNIDTGGEKETLFQPTH